MIRLLATDLDRTLFPNGIQPYDGTMPIFKYLIRRHRLPLVFVTGRHLRLVLQGIAEYSVPLPDYIIGDVGSTIWIRQGEHFIRDNQWDEEISRRTAFWDTEVLKESFSGFSGIRLQEESKQGKFKLSYYIDHPNTAKAVLNDIEKKLLELDEKGSVRAIYSVDETKNQGLLDFLPKSATKEKAIEFAASRHLNIAKDEVLYSGDSGNDILPLTYGFYGVMVRNTLPEVQKRVFQIAKEKHLEQRIYLAKGRYGLNGYYVSGIIEGLLHFGVVKKEEFLSLITHKRLDFNQS